MSADNPRGGDRHGDKPHPEQPPGSQHGEAAIPRPPAETRTMADLARERYAKSPIQPDSPATAATERAAPPTHCRGSLSGETQPQGEHHPGGRNVITHIHGEFNGKATDLYTDGTRWAPGDTVTQAARDNGHQTRSQHPGDLPAARDQGRNIVGEKPDRSPGDTSDLPPTGEELVEPDDTDAPRPEQLRNLFNREFGDIDDAGKNTATSIQQVLDNPSPTGHPGTVADNHSQWSSESPHLGTPDAGSMVELGLVLGVLGNQAVHWIRQKAAELRGHTDASH